MSSPGKVPNIVLIHGHDLGRHFGCYGRSVRTPNLDALAEQGMRFDNCFTPSPQCSPSRAAMMTGRYPHRNGMMGLAHLGWRLDQPERTLPRRLRKLGYETVLFGEQHEAETAQQLGYSASFATEWPQLAQGVTAAFIRGLPDLAHSAPFFASVGFFEGHRPFDHPGYDDDPPESVTVPPYLPDTYAVRTDLGRLNGRVKAVDQAVGDLTAALERAGIDETTVVIFTSDHGVAFPRAKGTLYDPGIELPLIVRGPVVASPGSSSDALVSNLDLLPSLVTIAGGSADDDLDGIDLSPVLAGKPAVEREHSMHEMTWHDAYVPLRGVRTACWKYIRSFASQERPYLPADVEESPSGVEFRLTQAGSRRQPGEELYDLSKDPAESVNLIGEPGSQEVLEDLRRRLEDWMEEGADPLLRSGLA